MISQQGLFWAASLLTALFGAWPASAREIPLTDVKTWQSIERIADFAFIPPDEDFGEEVCLQKSEKFT